MYTTAPVETSPIADEHERDGLWVDQALQEYGMSRPSISAWWNAANPHLQSDSPQHVWTMLGGRARVRAAVEAMTFGYVKVHLTARASRRKVPDGPFFVQVAGVRDDGELWGPTALTEVEVYRWLAQILGRPSKSFTLELAFDYGDAPSSI